ncbi:MAG: hypothetical protein ABUT39_21565 [Acidobacteriota bacterium]
MSRSLSTCVLASSLLASAAWAGTVYVPLPGVTQVGTAAYEAEVAVTNMAAPAASTNQVLLTNDTDGTQRAGQPATLQVPGNRTVIAKPGAAFRGLLELNGSPNLRYAARLAGKGAAGALGVALPVITSDNLKAANGNLVLQGLTRTDNRATNLTLVNLGKFPATCTVTLLRADGSSLGAASTATLKALSQRYFPDLFSVVPGAANQSDLRAAVSCTREFFAYALLTDSATGEVAVVEPSGTGESTLSVPGAEPECPAGATCYAAKGVIHKATKEKPVGRVTFVNTKAGTATRLKLTLDVTVGDWFAADPDAKHLVYWFVINKNQDMPGMLYFRGPDEYTALARHGIALKHPQKLKITAPFQAVPGRTYRVVNDYDMGKGLYTITVMDLANGEIKATLTDAPNVAKYTLKTTDKFLIDLGFPEGVTEDEVPGYNWTWSDVRVEVYY